MLAGKLWWIIPSLKINNLSMSCQRFMLGLLMRMRMRAAGHAVLGRWHNHRRQSRSIVSTATRSRGRRRGRYPEAWLLYFSCHVGESSAPSIKWSDGRAALANVSLVLNEKQRRADKSFHLLFSAENAFFLTQVKEICQLILCRQRSTCLKKFLDKGVSLLSIISHFLRW